MKKWEMRLVTGIFFLVVGLVVSVWGFQAIEHINIEQVGNEIIASLDPTFIGLFMLGFFFIGLGVGEATSTHTIYKLEKQLTREHLLIPSPETKKFCRHCGVENKEDAVFCRKCGKDIREA